jgi:UDP-2,3-diacylglucosamine pyrophosphatase LpxH
MAKRGTEVVYIPGNHDEMFRAWLGLEVAGVRLQREAVHRTADGRRLLVIHGDEFDGVIRYAKFLALLGDWAYDWALTLNLWFNAARRRLGYPYWSLSQWLKRQVKGA